MSDPKEKRKKGASSVKTQTLGKCSSGSLSSLFNSTFKKSTEDSNKNYAVTPIEEKKIGIVIRVTKPFATSNSKKRKVSADKLEPSPKKTLVSSDSVLVENDRSSSIDRSSNMSPTMPELHKETPFVANMSHHQSEVKGKTTRSKVNNSTPTCGRRPNLRSSSKSITPSDSDQPVPVTNLALLPPIITAAQPEPERETPAATAMVATTTTAATVVTYMPKKITCKLGDNIIVKTFTSSNVSEEHRSKKKSKGRKSSKSSKDSSEYLQVKSISGLKIKLAKPKPALAGQGSGEGPSNSSSIENTSNVSISHDQTIETPGMATSSVDDLAFNVPTSALQLLTSTIVCLSGESPASSAVQFKNTSVLNQAALSGNSMPVNCLASAITVVSESTNMNSCISHAAINHRKFQLETGEDGKIKIKLTQEKEVLMPDGKKKKLRLKMFVPSVLATSHHPPSSPQGFEDNHQLSGNNSSSSGQTHSPRRPTDQVNSNSSQESTLPPAIVNVRNTTQLDLCSSFVTSSASLLQFTSGEKLISSNMFTVPGFNSNRTLDTPGGNFVAHGEGLSPCLTAPYPLVSSPSNEGWGHAFVSNSLYATLDCSKFTNTFRPICSPGSSRNFRSHIDVSTHLPNQSQVAEGFHYSSPRIEPTLQNKENDHPEPDKAANLNWYSTTRSLSGAYYSHLYSTTMRVPQPMGFINNHSPDLPRAAETLSTYSVVSKCNSTIVSQGRNLGPNSEEKLLNLSPLSSCCKAGHSPSHCRSGRTPSSGNPDTPLSHRSSCATPNDNFSPKRYNFSDTAIDKNVCTRKNTLETNYNSVRTTGDESDDYGEMPTLEKNEISNHHHLPVLDESGSNQAMASVEGIRSGIEEKSKVLAPLEKENVVEKPNKKRTFRFDGLELEYFADNDTSVENSCGTVRRLRRRSKEEKEDAEKSDKDEKLEAKRKRGTSRTGAKKHKTSSSITVPLPSQSLDEAATTTSLTTVLSSKVSLSHIEVPSALHEVMSNVTYCATYPQLSGVHETPSLSSPSFHGEEAQLRSPSFCMSSTLFSPVSLFSSHSFYFPSLSSSYSSSFFSSSSSTFTASSTLNHSWVAQPISSSKLFTNSYALDNSSNSVADSPSWSVFRPTLNLNLSDPSLPSHPSPLSSVNLTPPLSAENNSSSSNSAPPTSGSSDPIVIPPSPSPPPPPPKFVRSFKEVEQLSESPLTPSPEVSSASLTFSSLDASLYVTSETANGWTSFSKPTPSSPSSLDQTTFNHFTPQSPSSSNFISSQAELKTKSDGLASASSADRNAFGSLVLLRSCIRDKSALFEEKSKRLHRISQRLQANSAISLKSAKVQSEETSEGYNAITLSGSITQLLVPSREEEEQLELERRKAEEEEESQKRLEEYYLSHKEEIGEFISNQTQLVKLRNKAYRLFCCLFPEIQTPLRLSPDSEAIDQLLESAVSVLEGKALQSKTDSSDLNGVQTNGLDDQRKSALSLSDIGPNKDLDVKDEDPSSGKVVQDPLQPKVVLCCRPEGCLSQLRNLVRRFLLLVLPHLEAYLSSDASLCIMDKIVDRVVLANCAFIGLASSSGPSRDTTEEENGSLKEVKDSSSNIEWKDKI